MDGHKDRNSDTPESNNEVWAGVAADIAKAGQGKKPDWMVQNEKNCAYMKDVEQAYGVPLDGLALSMKQSACQWNPDALHILPKPVDGKGASLFGRSTVAQELPKTLEHFRESVVDHDRIQLAIDDLAREKLILTPSQYPAYVSGINQKLPEWMPDLKVLPDGTLYRGDETKGKTFLEDTKGNKHFKGWGPKPEDNFEDTIKADEDGLGGYTQTFNTKDPNNRGFVLRSKPDYSYTIVYEDGKGQSRDAYGHIKTGRIAR